MMKIEILGKNGYESIFFFNRLSALYTMVQFWKKKTGKEEIITYYNEKNEKNWDDLKSVSD